MNKFEMARFGVNIIAFSCVDVVITEAIKKITPANLSKMKKVGMCIGSFVIADYASTKIGKFVDDQFTIFKNFLDTCVSKEIIEVKPVEIEETKEDASKEPGRGYMKDLKKFCNKHSIEMSYDENLRTFKFSDEQGHVLLYNFYRTNDLRSGKEMESYEKFISLIERIKRTFKIEEE